VNSYSNSDEISNGTDPNNAADVPPDWDEDFVSNLLDPNDDNDLLPDTVRWLLQTNPIRMETAISMDRLESEMAEEWEI
jgi:hypothetical protein